MKKIVIFLMFAMMVVIAASNTTPEKAQAPDFDVGYVIDINNDIEATIFQAQTEFITTITGFRQEGVTDVTIRSAPTYARSIYSRNYFSLPVYTITKEPAIVFRV